MQAKIAPWLSVPRQQTEVAYEGIASRPSAPTPLRQDAQGRWPEPGVADGYLHHSGVLSDGEFLRCEGHAKYGRRAFAHLDGGERSRGESDRADQWPVYSGSGPGSGKAGRY